MELVSIVTALYNAEKYIEETAQSVFAQTYTNWEWIIVNDCSKDSSAEIVEKMAQKDKRIRIIHNEKNLKTALTRNRGIDEAKGRYLAFIDSDDLWTIDKLEKQVSFMELNQASLSFHAYKKFRGDVSQTGSLIMVRDKVNYSELLKTNSISCLSAMYDTKRVGKVHMPDGYKAREDYLCWLQILKKSDYAYGMNECLGFYRIIPSSYSANKAEVAKLQWKIYRNHEKIGFLSSCIHFAFYALNGYMKYKVI
jgi:teichuronic acid biosynthesis glycosyltransferase TuaG